MQNFLLMQLQPFKDETQQCFTNNTKTIPFTGTKFGTYDTDFTVFIQRNNFLINTIFKQKYFVHNFFIFLPIIIR